MVIRRIITAACLLAFAGAHLPAQGLADAARKAKDQSAANEGRGTEVTKLSISPLDGDLEEVPLTTAVLQQYLQTGLSLSKEFDRDIRDYQSLKAAMEKVTRLRDMAGVYEAVPRLKAAIEFNGFTPVQYIDVALTIRRANSRASSEKIATPMSPLQTANTVFMRNHQSELRTENRLGRTGYWPLPWPRYGTKY